MESETLYRRLRQHLDRAPVGFPATESGVEIRILKRLFTPEEAEIALELSAIPEPASAIHKRLKSKLALDALTTRLAGMAAKRVIHGFPVQGEIRYAKMVWAIGMYEGQATNLTAEFQRDAGQYMDEAFHRAFHTRKTTQMRIVPVNKTLAAERNVATYDDIRAHVAASPGPFAKMSCICRHGKELLGGKCTQTTLRENCLTIGVAAAAMAQHGAQLIKREEMLALLDEADRQGLVLQPENSKSPLFVCCCCGCCCGVLTSAKRLPRPAEFFTSSFYAAVNVDDCQSCWTCQSRCQMDAIVEHDGKAQVDRDRCIGCGLCVSTCPSEAMRLEAKAGVKEPPADTKALYLQLLEDRYGRWGMAKIGARKLLGMKI